MNFGRGRTAGAPIAPAAWYAVVALALALRPLPASAAPGDLDQGFGSGGLVVTDLGADDEAIRALAARFDGKLLAAGHTVRAGERVVAVVRYSRDGSVDTTFGVDGIATHDLGPGDDEAFALILLPEGNLLLGAATNGAGVVVRLTRTGALDTTFASGGIAAATRGPVVGLAQTALGGIVAGADDEVVRLTADGVLDSSFGNGGRLTGFGGRALVVLPGDGIVGAGGPALPSFDFLVWRATAAGQIDGEFGTERGRTDVFPNPGAARGFGIVALPDGRLAAAGYREGESPLARRYIGVGRLRADGRFDTSFNGDGKRLLDELHGHDTAYAMIRQPDGALVVAGDSCRLMSTRTSCPGWTFVLARLRPNGTPDMVFGAAGFVTTRFPAASRADAHAYALVLQSDGMLVAAGTASSGDAADFALARYLSGLDPTPTRTPTATRGTPTVTRTPANSATPGTGTPTRNPTGAATATPSSIRPPTPTHTFAPETPLTCPAMPPTVPAAPCSEGCSGRAVRVADINPAPPPCAIDHEPAQYLPSELIHAASGAFFLFDDCHTGVELWHTDGTAAATRLVKDVRPGPAGSDIEMLTALDGAVVFLADDGLHGRELWRSDGTEAGTRMIGDLSPGPLGVTLRGHAAVDSRFFFVLGTTLWRSDGTEDGTAALRDFASNRFSSLDGPQSLTAFDGGLFFVAPSAAGDGLWRSDGTGPGTGLVKLLGGSGCAGGPMRAAGGALYLRGFSLPAGCELWRTDGSPAGTLMVRDLNPGPVGSLPDPYAGLDGVVVFAATTPDRGLELWRSDGTADGTTPLGDLVPGEGSALTCTPVRDVVGAGRMYFLADDGRGCELWRSDGTGAGTQLVRELVPGTGDAGIDGLTAIGDLVVFAAATAANGREPWRSDGSSAGTIVLADLAPGPADSLPADFPFVAAATADAAVFAAKDGTGTSLLWRTDGTAGGTEPVTGFAAAGSRGSAPEALTATGGVVVYAATSPDGRGVWRGDARSLSASRAALLAPSTPAGAQGFAALGDLLLYTTNAPPALWSIDGGEPPRLLRQLDAGALLGSPLAIDGTAVFFVGRDGRDALWRTDGTTAGTGEITANLISARSAVGAGDHLLFVAGAPDDATIWRSDGTAATTRPILRVVVEPEALTVSGPRFFYFTESLLFGRDLWVSDGTLMGTDLLELPAPDADPRELVGVGGAVFFTAATATSGRELWRSDGTAFGTRLVRDLRPGRQGSFPTLLANVAGRLFFAADDGCTGRGLWTSDGTRSGTRLVAPVSPLTIGAAGERAVFAGYDPQAGAELWLADAGSAARQADIAPGTASSFPDQFTVSGDDLFFVADDGSSGRELWAMPLDGLVLPPTPTTTVTPLVSATPTPSATTAPTGPQICTGDCQGDGAVQIEDLITGVNIALEQTPLAACFRFDRNADSRVTIEELILALNYALNGCP